MVNLLAQLMKEDALKVSISTEVREIQLDKNKTNSYSFTILKTICPSDVGNALLCG